jgi:drug/metabolite transporter (DMT)-like permease
MQDYSLIPKNWAYLGMACVVCANVLASVLLKIGAGEPHAIWFLSWKSLLGLGAFGIAGLSYAYTLRALPLNEAQIITSLQFVGVIIAAALFLGEPISSTRIIGIVLIAIGIAVCYQ